jgi:hypothetical protein
VYVVAQSLVGQRQADKLTTAIAVLSEGKLEQAKELLSRIGPGDPAYPAAQRYLALCLHEAGDWRGFLKLTEQMDLTAPVVPAEIREELAFRQIDALFRARKFEEIFGRIEAFQQRYPGSGHLAAVTEYRLASLFERGMKKAYEGAALTDPTKSAARWAEAQPNLAEFLAIARGKSGYTVLPKRNLEEEVWAARLALGEEAAWFAEVPSSDSARRERLSLVRLYVCKKLYPDQGDRLIELMRGFVREFPESTNRPKVEYDLADLSFEMAEKLWLQLCNSVHTNNGPASDKWDAIRAYHALGREVAGRLLRNKGAGLEPQDRLHLWQDYLLSYYIQADYDGFAAGTAVLLAESEPGSLGWLMAKVNEAVVLACNEPSRSREAGELFDQIMSLGFRDKPAWDQWITCAAKWRVYLALREGNRTEAEATAGWVRTSNCSKTLKQDFMNVYRSLIGHSE